MLYKYLLSRLLFFLSMLQIWNGAEKSCKKIFRTGENAQQTLAKQSDWAFEAEHSVVFTEIRSKKILKDFLHPWWVFSVVSSE